MQLEIVGRLGDGAFGEVYEAEDALGRRVAVKIVRSSGVALSTALDHARALARAQHANVVSVFALDRIQDPEGGQEADCVVMELLRGETLTARLKGPRCSAQEVRSIGLGLIEGLKHIHAQGIAHGDLHGDNIMVVGAQAKIIDILYLDSLALLSTATREARLRRDLLNLRVLIYELLMHSELDPGEAVEFNTRLGTGATLQEMRAELLAVLDPNRAQSIDLHVQHALRRVREAGFVEGDQYAKAMADETPPSVAAPLLAQLIDEKCVEYKHRPYVRLLWERLSDGERDTIAQKLGDALDREAPRGHWTPHINMLAAFGRTGWAKLSAVRRLRLEALVVNDVLAGHHDIYRPTVGHPGTLGTYVKSLWPYFANRDALVQNLAVKLGQNWYSQNYVGKNFMRLLPLLGDTPARRELLISGLVQAVKNDAKLIVRELSSLPADWQAEITRRTGKED